jgi:hypothetical protein
MEMPESWEVEIRLKGEAILTIGSWGLCGVGNIADHADLVRHCAEHLNSFIGTEEATPFFDGTDNNILEPTNTTEPISEPE